MIRVVDGTLRLYYGAVNWLAHPTIEGFGKYYVIPEDDYEELFSDDFSDFEIIPRDPETYKDWHVGDKIASRTNSKGREVIFRCGEAVFCKNLANGDAIGPYTCEELFEKDWRLVLTDIEKQIIEEKKKAEWKPQDGDVIAFGSDGIGIFNKLDEGIIRHSDHVVLSGGDLAFDEDGWTLDNLRPATDEEKQRLFDAMEKDGKRWNAEKKVVEDISEPYEFRKGEPVLVRNYDDGCWMLAAFSKKLEDVNHPYEILNDFGNSYTYRKCIPYNEKTMHLLGTNDDYEEEQS